MTEILLHWQLMDKLRRVGGKVEQSLHPFCSSKGITPLQLFILLSLHFEGPQTVTGLAKSTCIAGTNNSSLCKKMEKDGLVQRVRDAADERQVQVSLTQKGEALMQDFYHERSSCWQQMPNKLSQKELGTLLEKLDILLASLQYDYSLETMEDPTHE